MCLCILCDGCRSSRSISQHTAAELHEGFDNTTSADSADISGSVAGLDTAAVSFRENSADTIRIQRDEAGRPVFIVWHHNANMLETFGSWSYSDFGLTRFHMSAKNHNAGTVDATHQKEEESKTQVNATLSIDKIVGPILLGLVVLYVIYVIIADGLWPKVKKLISSKLSNK
ncbi:MAG: hypothetical protein K2M06_04080 [Muribaculaceae bacterium]|nr:hypothetical protein [Muribaculaceae bacterium]